MTNDGIIWKKEYRADNANGILPWLITCEVIDVIIPFETEAQADKVLSEINKAKQETDFKGSWTIYDLEAVNAVFNSLTPRPVHEIMREIYPDATRDRQGRFHAPYEGYRCPMTDQVFRAGEYLPEPEKEDESASVGRKPSYPVGYTLDGERHEWQGTRRQHMAVWAELKRQADAKRAADFGHAVHLGTVGEKLTANVKVHHIFSREGFYGIEYTTIMHTDDRNVIVYRGAKALGEKGALITVSGKVKRHDNFKGINQTVIERPKVMHPDAVTEL